MISPRYFLIPLAALSAFWCNSAHAADVGVAFDFSSLTGTPGATLTFSGILTNQDAETVDLNSCQVTILGQFTSDCTPFLTYAPYFLAGNASSADFPMFEVTVDLPYTVALGPQSGSFQVLGGVEGPGGYDSSTQNILGAADFTITVTPEPVTLWGAAFALLLATRIRPRV